MTIWRMAMRAGSRGPSMLEQCLKLGVAAITYPHAGFDEIDLNNFAKHEPKQNWDKLAPSQHSSLSRIAYEMTKGDIIYAKEGGQIYSKGIVDGKYFYDYKKTLRCKKYGNYWFHQIPVSWDETFIPINILLGAEQNAILELSNQRITKLEAALNQNIKENEYEQRILEAYEGESYKAIVNLRKRVPALIAAKKLNSDGRCEACFFNFNEKYGHLSKDCLIAHHVDPIGFRTNPKKTTINDLVLLCPNCHSIIHSQNPPIKIKTLMQNIKTKA
jgi:predicted HNH restriction endonuclease